MSATSPSSSLEVSPFGNTVRPEDRVLCPPDKSITHRSLIFASMAKGRSSIASPLLGADCQSTMGVFRALGVKIGNAPETPDLVHVESPGWDHWTSPLVPLDMGNSGTTTRLLTGVFAATPGLFVTMFGDASLSARPMARVSRPLRQAGASITGRSDAQYLPMAVVGQPLKPMSHQSDKASAQVKSALILAGLNIAGETTVLLPHGGRDHTERMLVGLGAQLSVTREGDLERITVRGPFRPSPRHYSVPGDPSSAAFLATLAALRPGGRLKIERVLVNPTRTGFVQVMRRMGVVMTESEPRSDDGLLEPVCDLEVPGGVALRSVTTAPEEAPAMIDEIPILAVLALFAEGTSVFRGLSELRVKESDRLQKTVQLLTSAGGEAWTEQDDLHVRGLGSQAKVKAFTYDPALDHRLAMAGAILAKRATAPCRILDPDCVAVSFPGFFDLLNQLG